MKHEQLTDYILCVQWSNEQNVEQRQLCHCESNHSRKLHHSSQSTSADATSKIITVGLIE